MEKILTERGTYTFALMDSERNHFFVNEEDGSVMIQDDKGKPLLDGSKARNKYLQELKMRLN